MQEIWRDIPKYEGCYMCSNFGRVKSLKRKGKIEDYILGERFDNYGYQQVLLCKPGNQYNVRVHVLVARLFVHNPQNKPHVNHLDGNKGNPHYLNLEWCTHSENHKHAYAMGLKPKMPSIKLTEQQAIEIYNSDENIGILAERYGLVGRSIYQIKDGRSWGKITGQVYNKKDLSFYKKRVIKMDLNGINIAEFKSISDAAKSVNGRVGDISRVCKGIKNSYKKFKWKFSDKCIQ